MGDNSQPISLLIGQEKIDGSIYKWKDDRGVLVVSPIEFDFDPTRDGIFRLVFKERARPLEFIDEGKDVEFCGQIYPGVKLPPVTSALVYHEGVGHVGLRPLPNVYVACAEGFTCAITHIDPISEKMTSISVMKGSECSFRKHLEWARIVQASLPSAETFATRQ